MSATGPESLVKCQTDLGSGSLPQKLCGHTHVAQVGKSACVLHAILIQRSLCILPGSHHALQREVHNLTQVTKMHCRPCSAAYSSNNYGEGLNTTDHIPCRENCMSKKPCILAQCDTNIKGALQTVHCSIFFTKYGQGRDHMPWQVGAIHMTC